MDGARRKRVRATAKRSRGRRTSEGDLISDLPDSLLCQVLLKLTTKEVVRTSVLSRRWSNLWKHVPGLDLENRDFPDHNTFVSFVDTFLGFNWESCLHNFKLNYDCDGNYEPEPEIGLIKRWVNTVVDRKVKHLHVWDDSNGSWDVMMLPTIYTCESLVSLTLCALTLPSPKYVSLPSLKVISLVVMKFSDDALALETLISRCPVLESLSIGRSFDDNIEVLRVCSHSLLSFTHIADGSEDLDEDLVVIVDAPRLKFLKLSDGRVASFILKNPSSLVKADINTEFNLSFGKKFDPDDLPKRIMLRNFLVAISNVKDLIIASNTLMVIYDYSRCEPLPLFRNLSSMRVKFYSYTWEMLPIFLESCPNLQSLVMGSTNYPEKEGIDILSGPRRVLSSSLKYVKIERPLKGEAMEMKLVSYILENSTGLKKLTLCLDDSIKKEESVIFRELLTIPRLSTSCQVVVL
ncbi:PREDICTED: F-box/LRR-repeat protein 13-like [Camelina sativa]|uniref:F-box/LRR-repeat protein 13-like n=1 Tax=Camelina sativa TaxID=90675 RepID=A0ABM0TQF0_CAMSA|nr:PREDICTED: F-box/LRR-repeat protein 13-like [Camelina sativa]